MRKLAKQAKVFDLFVIRFAKDGSRRISRPCELCIYYMKNQTNLKINKVYYFNDNGEMLCEKLYEMDYGVQSFGLRNFCDKN